MDPLTDCHHFLHVGAPEFHHDRISISVNDHRIMGMAIGNGVPLFHKLKGHTDIKISNSNKEMNIKEKAKA